ncbi:hypothetical protein OROGR_018713 [Orobanche gracilis]
MVDGSESKTLAENPSDKGLFSEGVRVWEDSNVMDGDSNTRDVINARRKESITSIRIQINDELDTSKSEMRSRSSRWDSWESWGVMDMVGRVLGGNFSMDEGDDVEDVSTSNNGREANAVEVDDRDTYKNGRDTNVVKVEDENTFRSRCETNVVEVGKISISKTGREANIVEVEDVTASKNGCEENVVMDTNTWQSVIGEPSSVGNSSTERIVVEKDSDDLNPDYLVEGIDLKEDKYSLPNELVPDGTGSKGDRDSLSIELAQPGGTGLNGDSLSNELVPDEAFETAEVNKVEVDLFFVPKTRGKQQITEKEGEYSLSDLVWGKVNSHPWWPGQIFPPTAASDKAEKHFRKQSYLIAYFGDQTFAWNEGSQLRPFHMYFSQMQKQSNSDGFSHAMSRALAEVTRRVEFGLSCPCLSEEVLDKIKIQVVSNAGIREDKNVVEGGDSLSSAASFLPENLFEFLKSLAECPRYKTDRLQFTTAKAQLLAFNRWKGHYKLPVFEGYVGLFEDDTQVNVKEEGLFPYGFSSKKIILSTRDGSSQKRKHPSGEKEFPTLKEKCISALMSSSTSILPNLDVKPVKRFGRRPISSGKNSERNNYIASNFKAKRRKSTLPTSPIGGKSREADLRIGEESDLVEIILSEIPTPDVIRSKLILSAKVPMEGFKIMISEVDFLRELRNLVCLENKSSFRNAEMDGGKHKGKEPANLESANIFGLEGTKDSYWTDIVIQIYSQDQVFFEPENPNDKAVQVEEADIKEGDAVVNLDHEKPSDEYQRTALILNFTNLDSIPCLTNLNEIFNRYGPLNESETEILCKSKRAKLIFKRRADAETAFSSTGKYSIFGPSLVSYKLHYAPTPCKSHGASKRSKKDTSSKVDS